MGPGASGRLRGATARFGRVWSVVRQRHFSLLAVYLWPLLPLFAAVAAATAAATAVAGLALLQFLFEPPALFADLEVPIFDYGLVMFLCTFFPGLVF